jgi:hypothetical protein
MGGCDRYRSPHQCEVSKVSAFVVSDEHINYMLNAFRAYRTVGGLGLTDAEVIAMGAMLREENNASVRWLYEGRYPEDEGAPYTTYRDVRVDPITTIKAVHCYRYQACEHDGWERSEAKKWCEALEAYAINHLPGYEYDAPWGIDTWQPPVIELKRIY